MIRSLLFDFNGVIIDDEPVHFKLFQEVLAEQGVALTQDTYYKRYLGMDDHDCFAAAYKDQNQAIDEKHIQSLIEKKAKIYEVKIKEGGYFVPGVLELIQGAKDQYHMGIVSGALRSEIESILNQTKIRDAFSVIVAAGEVRYGKPSPDGFLKALELLNRDFVPTHEMLLPGECLVLEDSIWGIEAASAAEMSCVALTTSYPKEQLPGAVDYLPDFKNLDLKAWMKKLNA